MIGKPKVLENERTVTVHVPISIRKRGGRKLVLAPNGKNLTGAPAHRRVDSAMVKAVARAFRWRDMLESGKYATIREIAIAEKINETYIGRILRLTLLAPWFVDAILNGRRPIISLGKLMRRLPVEWRQQTEQLS
jgi:hypothetical protein